MSYVLLQKPSLTVKPGELCKTTSKISIKRSKKAKNGGLSAGTVSSEIQQNDGTSIEHLLTVLIPQIEHTAVTKDDTGCPDADLFKLFGDTLTGDALTLHNSCLTEANLDETTMAQAGAFKTYLHKYLARYTNSTNMMDTMFRYLEHDAKKTFDQDPHAFHRRFKLILKSATYFEGVKQYPSVAEIKDWYISCFSKTHVTQYAKNKDYATQSCDEITQYMQMLHEEEQANGTIERMRRGRDKGQKRRSDDDSRSGKSSRDARRRNNRRSDRDDRRSRSDKHSSNGGLRYNDPCPNHPDSNHVWGKCNLNPRNKNKENEPSRKKYKKDHAKDHTHYHDDGTVSEDEESFTTASSGSDHSEESHTSEESEKPRKRSSKKKKKKSSKKKHHSHHVDAKDDDAGSTLSVDEDLYNDE